jgi:hypothetical protein
LAAAQLFANASSFSPAASSSVMGRRSGNHSHAFSSLAFPQMSPTSGADDTLAQLQPFPQVRR